MTWLSIGGSGRLRVLATSVLAAAQGLFNIVARRHRAPGTPLSPGDEAPDFELPASDGRTYRLSSFRGKSPVVIAWFPKAFTGGCTVECRSLEANSGAIRQLDAAFFGANMDSPGTNRKFAAALGLSFPVLSDPQGAAARAYGVMASSGFPRRWTFYVGADGRILAIDRHVRVSTHGDDVEERLAGFGIRRHNS